MEHQSRFNAIVVIDSLSPSELQTARNLVADLRVQAAGFDFVDIEHHLVTSKAELFQLLEQFATRARDSGLSPVIHFEAHGDQHRGIKLRSKEFVHWAELIAPLTEINIACHNYLLLSFAMCQGGHLLSILSATVGARSAFSALIAPESDLPAGELHDAFVAFYESLFRRDGLEIALERLRASAPSSGIVFAPCELLFVATFRSYLQVYCTPHARIQRADNYVSALGLTGKEAERMRTDAIELMRPENQQDAFQYIADQFFLLDLYPENRERHDFDYGEILEGIQHEA